MVSEYECSVVEVEKLYSDLSLEATFIHEEEGKIKFRTDDMELKPYFPRKQFKKILFRTIESIIMLG